MAQKCTWGITINGNVTLSNWCCEFNNEATSLHYRFADVSLDPPPNLIIELALQS